MPNDDFLSLLSDPLLSHKFLDFANYPETNRLSDAEIARQVMHTIYDHLGRKSPIYYNNDNSPTAISKFVRSPEFEILKSELDSCLKYLVEWTNEHFDATDKVSIENNLNTFFTQLKSDYFSDYRASLYSDGKKYIEMLSILLRNTDIDINFRKEQIINLLSDEGLSHSCAPGCLTRLYNTVDALRNYGQFTPSTLIKQFIVATTEEVSVTPYYWLEIGEIHNIRQMLCKVSNLHPIGDEIHARNYLLDRLKSDWKLFFLDIPPDPFIKRILDSYKNPQAGISIHQVYDVYLKEIQQSLQTTHLIQFINSKINEQYQLLSTEDFDIRRRFIEESLPQLGRDNGFELQEILSTTGDLKHDKVFYITIAERLFDTQWLHLDTSQSSRLFSFFHYFYRHNPNWRNGLLFPPFTDDYKIFYSNLALSWVKINDERQLILAVISQEEGLKQLQNILPYNADSINSLLQTPDELNLFFEHLHQSNYLAGLEWINPYLAMSAANSFHYMDIASMHLIQNTPILNNFSNRLKSYSKIIKFLKKNNIHLLISALIKLETPLIKPAFQNLIKEKIRLDEISSNDFSLTNTITLLIELGFKDFSDITFYAYPYTPSELPLEQPPISRTLPPYLLDIYFIGINLINVKFKENIFRCIFKESNLSGALFQGVVKNTIFNDVNLQGVNFKNICLEAIYFKNAKLKKANFKNAVFREGISFVDSDLQKTDFRGSIFYTTGYFIDGNLQKANFQGAIFHEKVYFGNSNLKESDFSDCDISNLNLDRSKLEGVILRNTILNPYQFLDDFHLNGVKDFSTVHLSVSDDIDKKDFLERHGSKTLTDAILSEQVFDTLAKLGFHNFQGTHLHAVSHQVLALYYSKPGYNFEQASLPEGFLEEISKSSDLVRCLDSRTRKKRSENDCLFSWEDIDPFNEEKEATRDPKKIIINSKKFIAYIKKLSNIQKQEQLVTLIDSLKITGTEENDVHQLIRLQKVKQHFSKVRKYAGYLTQGLISKNIISDIVENHAKDLAINLSYLLASGITEKSAEKIFQLGDRLITKGNIFLGKALKLSSSFLSRGTSTVIVYDLINQIKALQMQNKEALVNVISDSIFVGLDLFESGIELLELAGILEGISSLTGPISAALSAFVFLGTEIYAAVKTVEKIDELIHLARWEKLDEGLRAFFGLSPEIYIEEKIELAIAYQKLFEQLVKALKIYPQIKRYVSPALKAKVNYPTAPPSYNKYCRPALFMGLCLTKEMKTSITIEIELNNTFAFYEKNNQIHQEMKKPPLPAGTELFCSPLGEGDFVKSPYHCDKAIGLELPSKNPSNHTLIALGIGNDAAIGLIDSPNIFLVQDGNKYFFGGAQDNHFILQGNHTTGTLHGGYGRANTLNLQSFALKKRELTIHLYDTVDPPVYKNKQRGVLYHSGYNNTLLYFFNINQLIGRKNKTEVVGLQAGDYIIDLQGGTADYPDKITITDSEYPANLTLIVRPCTHVINTAITGGNFSYMVSTHTDTAFKNHNQQTLMTFPANQTLAQYRIILNTTLAEIDTIDIASDFKKRNIIFHFVSGASATFVNPPRDILYGLSDTAKIKIGSNNLYGFQKVNGSARVIITNYLPIAHRLKMSLIIHSTINNEIITMGSPHHEVIYNDPSSDKSHLIGNAGEDIYVIYSGQVYLTSSQLPLNDIELYHLDADNKSIDNLDLRNIIHQAYRDLNSETRLVIDPNGEDLFLYLLTLPQEKEKKSNLVISIRLNKGINWYKRLHVLLNQFPKAITYDHNKWHLADQPLVFDKEKSIIIISDQDIEKETQIIVDQMIGIDEWLRDGQDLIVTNYFSFPHDKNDGCTLLFKDFYKSEKMPTLTLQFLDRLLKLENLQNRINQAKDLQVRLNQFNQMTDHEIFSRARGRKEEKVQKLRVKRTLSTGHFNASNEALGTTYQKDKPGYPTRSHPGYPLSTFFQKSMVQFSERWSCKQIPHEKKVDSNSEYFFSSANTSKSSTRVSITDMDFHGFLPWVMLGIAKYTGRPLPYFEKAQPLSHEAIQEAQSYAGALSEKIDDLVKKTAKRDGILLSTKDDIRWETSQRLQSTLQSALIQGEESRMDKAINNYIDNLSSKQFSASSKNQIIKKVQIITKTQEEMPKRFLSP